MNKWLEIFLVATVYVASARIGQIYAINPGNISPVWIPSGVMLAWVLIRGYYIWPGIFMGALIGNIWAYIDTSSIAIILLSIFSGSVNGLGDCLAAIGAIYFIKKYTGDGNPFKHLKTFLYFFLFGVLLGPLVSAILGVHALWTASFLPAEAYFISLITWFIGDAVGVLLITPIILLYFFPHEESHLKINKLELLAFILLLNLFPFIPNFPGNYLYLIQQQPALFLVPLFMWAALRFNRYILFHSAAYVLSISIIADYYGLGVFYLYTPLQSIMMLQFLTIVAMSSVFILYSLIHDKNKALDNLQLALNHDALTKIFNRQYFDKRLDEEINLQARYGSPFCIAMFDIDRFKDVNDTYGHLFGDKILIQLSQIAINEIRATDIIARWGGEELVILMPNTGIEGGKIIAERIRVAVENSPLLPSGVLTISFGLIEVVVGKKRTDIMNQVDGALYIAKNNGRNQVQCA